MATDTTDDLAARDTLDLPNVNPVPLVVAGGVALLLAIVLLVVVLGGGDEGEPEGEPVVLGDDAPPSSQIDPGQPAPEVSFDYFQGGEGFDGGEGTLDDY